MTLRNSLITKENTCLQISFWSYVINIWNILLVIKLITNDLKLSPGSVYTNIKLYIIIYIQPWPKVLSKSFLQSPRHTMFHSCCRRSFTSSLVFTVWRPTWPLIILWFHMALKYEFRQLQSFTYSPKLLCYLRRVL